MKDHGYNKKKIFFLKKGGGTTNSSLCNKLHCCFFNRWSRGCVVPRLGLGLCFLVLAVPFWFLAISLLHIQLHRLRASCKYRSMDRKWGGLISCPTRLDSTQKRRVISWTPIRSRNDGLELFPLYADLVTALGSCDGGLPPSIFCHDFASRSSISSRPFRYQFHERMLRSDLIFSMVANKGRKIGMQATTNPRFLSNLKFVMSNLFHVPKTWKRTENTTRKERDHLAYRQLWCLKSKRWRYLQVGSRLSSVNVTLLPMPQAAVLPSHQHRSRKWHVTWVDLPGTQHQHHNDGSFAPLVQLKPTNNKDWNNDACTVGRCPQGFVFRLE